MRLRQIRGASLVVAAILSVLAVSLVLVSRLDVIVFDEETDRRSSGRVTCRCDVADYAVPPSRIQTADFSIDNAMTSRSHNSTSGLAAVEKHDALLVLLDRARDDLARTGTGNSNDSAAAVAEPSLNDTRRTLDELKSAVRLIQQRLRDAMDSTADIHNNNFDNTQLYNSINGSSSSSVRPPQTRARDPIMEPVETLLQPQGAKSEEKRRARATAERYRRLAAGAAGRLNDDVIGLLRQAVAMTTGGKQRRPRPSETIESPVVHRSTRRRPWKEFDNSITQYALYPRNASVVDELIRNMATLSVNAIEEMSDKGTQLKLVLTLSDGSKVLFKPMRISKDVEANPNHFVFNEMERHHAEIAAFHLDRLFDFRRVPPVAGRYINMTSELIPIASSHLVKTFYISPVGNICFFGECKYYCDSHHAVCGQPDVIEGAAAIFLPNDDEHRGPYPRKTWPSPWAQVYSKRGKLPPWKTRDDYCDEIRTTPPYDTGRRLLDLMDMALFDFLTGNLDRHHYYTFKRFGNDTIPILTDNGRGFGRAHKDDIELLAPIYQCCLIRASTLEKIVDFASADMLLSSSAAGPSVDRPSLSQAISRSLTSDVIDGVLHSGHLVALDRRIRTVALVVHDCLNRTLSPNGGVDRTRLLTKAIRRMVVDDGF